ncbi:MAG: hypothetical protein LBH19_05035 [Dysgonamonadaceae bacterium]|jgi:hypothetical protein|nr:hypothetical protein [Dysgonamonadaceae bacterium]
MRRIHFFWHLLFGLATIAGFGAVVMLLWNWLAPAIFGLTVINFWQALGLLALARILFGGMGKRWLKAGRMKHCHSNPIREKWMKMTPEERKEFVQRRHFGHGFRHDFFNEEKSEKKD